MILIDSLYINNGGGKILLDYLVERIEQKTELVYYIFDKRCENSYLNIPVCRKIYMESSLLKRHKFYMENKHRFSSVLCLGNLSPSLKLDIPVYTYFHQKIFLKVPTEFGLKQKLTFRLKTFVFKKLLRNTTKLIVQSPLMRDGLLKKVELSQDKVLCIPFYPCEDLINSSYIREKYTFIYVSNATPHKNHLRLIEAFTKFYDEYKIGKLIVTVSETYKEVFDLVSDLKAKDYPILNLGFIGRDDLISNYNKAEYLIYPSLDESFGLGIVEAIDCGCKVIGADLPYMYQVCTPSILFNPKDTNSIYNAFLDTLNGNVQPTLKIIDNEVDKLIDLLNFHQCKQ